MDIQRINSRAAADFMPMSLCEFVDDDECRSCLGELQQVRPYEVSHALLQSQPEFGLRLLVAIIYVARREATEGQIWPAVRSGLNLSVHVADILFHSNGQPRVEVKTLIEKTCRHFRLRHIFGQDGTQEWFGSIYLQFGFTQRGFAKMLPEWLMGYNQPNTIGRLLDDPALKSESFRKLWEALLSFRRGNAAEAVTRRIISESHWVLPEWADELLRAAKKKPHLSPATYRSGSSEAGEAPQSFLSAPCLVVGNKLAEAQWQIELAGLAQWALSGTSFCVRLRCGESAAQEVFLRKQPDGSLSNLTHTFEFPLASLKESQVSASITDQQGREVAAQDIQLFDPDADILAFSERGYLDDGFVKRGPRSNALCFVIIRSDLNLIPQSAEWHRFEGMGYKLHRLRVEAGMQLRVLSEDGDELWSSIAGDRSEQPAFLSRITPKCELSSLDNASLYDPGTTEIVLRVSGISDAEILSAQWRSHQLSIEQSQPAAQLPWRIRGIPKLEALLASRVLLKLRVRLGEVVYRTEIEWKPSVVGIFEQSRGRATCGEFFATRNKEQLERGRYIIIPKPLTLEQQERGLRWCLFEGDRFVSELREGSPQSLYGLGAYGQGLSIRFGQFNREENPTILVKEVADKGLFHIYAVNPFIGRDYTFDAWGTPEMGDDYTLHYGAMHERATSEVAGERLVFTDDKAMFAPFPNQPCDYLVLAYAGARLATWWRVLKDGSSWSSNLTEIRDDVDARRAAFTIRWAKLPVLSGHHYHQVKEFFRRFPHIVLGEWLCGCKERKDGRKIEDENTEAWHDAVRAIIQGYQIEHDELTTETKQKLIRCLPGRPTDDVNAKTLDTFQAVGACDPVLMGRMIHYWSKTAVAMERQMMRAGLLRDMKADDELKRDLQATVPHTSGDGFFWGQKGLIDSGMNAVIYPVPDERTKLNLKAALTIKPFRQLLCQSIINRFLPAIKRL